MRHVLGVDFSGARDSGRKIWLTVCLERDGALHVKSSVPAGAQFDGDSSDACLEGVREAIRRADVVGLDFPFALPAAVHDCDSWTEVATFVAGLSGPDALETVCAERAVEVTDGQQRYLRRRTDEACGALSPYHWINAARTYEGITTLLAPLAAEDAIAIKPVQDGSGTPVCEISPGATLRDLGLPSRGYRDDTDRASARRATIAEGLRMTPLAMHGIEEHLREDVGGDAIDSLLSALAAWRASRARFEADGDADPIEGYSYR